MTARRNLLDQRQERLEARHAVVVGGAHGIGRSAARRLAAEGAAVSIADIDVEGAEAVAAEIVAAGAHAIALECDITAEADVRRLYEESARLVGPATVLVTAAGIGGTAPSHEMAIADWQRVLDLNLTGTFMCIRESLPAMRALQRGSIITIGSAASVAGGAGPGTSSYAASKGGVLALTRAIAAEYATEGIRANCLCPGPVATAMGSKDGQIYRGLAGPWLSGVKPPMDRRAEPEEIAAAIAFLASDDASYVTGTAFMVDGGFTSV